MVIRQAVAAIAGFAAVVASAGVGVADPNIQLPGVVDDGMTNCGALSPRALAGWIGSDYQLPNRTMDETFASAPAQDWCTTDVGYSSLGFGPEGATLAVPRTADGLFPYNNAEVVSRPTFTSGQTMTMNVKGAPDMVDHNGTAGWGVSNRLIDPRALLGLEIAWFMYNGSHGAMGATADALSPVANVLGADMPHGFFLMVKRAGTLVPQIKLLDEKILAQDHAYAVQLGGEYVDFFIDGENVGTFRNPPSGQAIDVLGLPAPLAGQVWLDGSFWFPLPIPEYNAQPQTLTVTRYRQGPSESTPLL
ncbi:hypothetical protein [Nocardia salmonicida]|uniref:hypothetical protein n=1 Tax=Nocardia salmonicida TaxID=53431 RepID=UPI0037ABAD3D